MQELDPAVQARIEEAERIAAQAEAEAAAYAEHAANIQAEHDSLQQQQQQVLRLATFFAVAYVACCPVCALVCTALLLDSLLQCVITSRSCQCVPQSVDCFGVQSVRCCPRVCYLRGRFIGGMTPTMAV